MNSWKRLLFNIKVEIRASLEPRDIGPRAG